MALDWFLISAFILAMAFAVTLNASGPAYFFVAISAPIGLFCLGSAGIAFKSTRVVVGEDGLTITIRRLGIPSTRRVAREEIKSIRPRMEMKKGATEWLAIKVQTTNDDEFEAGSGIEGRKEADLLAAEMARLVGLEAETAKR